MTIVLSIALSGMSRHARAVENAAERIAYRGRADAARTDGSPEAERPDVAESWPSGVDLAAEFVRLERGRIGYGANAAVVRAADKMTGQLLELVR
jgi:hypothetical protein